MDQRRIPLEFLVITIIACSRREPAPTRAASATATPATRATADVAPIAVPPTTLPAPPAQPPPAPPAAILRAGPCVLVIPGGLMTRPIQGTDDVSVAATGTRIATLVGGSLPPEGGYDSPGEPFVAVQQFDATRFVPRGERTEASGALEGSGYHRHTAVAFAGLGTFGSVTYLEDPVVSGEGARQFALVPADGPPRPLPLGRITVLSGLATAGRDDRVISVVAAGSPRANGRPDDPNDATIDAFMISRNGVRHERVFTGTDDEDGGHRGASAPAVALGSGRIAIAWRYGQSIELALTSDEGRRLGSPRVLGVGDVGAPSVTWRGDSVVAVWAVRESARQPYRLAAIEWTPDATGSNAPPASTLLATGAASAFAPSVSCGTDGFTLLAWMEGSAREGTVRLASGSGPIATLVQTATPVSLPGVNARDPEVALTDQAAWIAWSQFPRPGTSGLMLSLLRCAAPDRAPP